jgi:hypothetical protein
VFQPKNSGERALLTQIPCLDTAIEAAKIVGIPLGRILLIGNDESNFASHFFDFINATQKVEPLQGHIFLRRPTNTSRSR